MKLGEYDTDGFVQGKINPDIWGRLEYNGTDDQYKVYIKNFGTETIKAGDIIPISVNNLIADVYNIYNYQFKDSDIGVKPGQTHSPEGCLVLTFKAGGKITPRNLIIEIGALTTSHIPDDILKSITSEEKEEEEKFIVIDTIKIEPHIIYEPYSDTSKIYLQSNNWVKRKSDDIRKGDWIYITPTFTDGVGDPIKFIFDYRHTAEINMKALLIVNAKGRVTDVEVSPIYKPYSGRYPGENHTKNNNFILSCFALTVAGIFQFFLTWYAIHYNESIKSPLLIILGFAVYLLCVGIFYLQSIIKDKNETINKILNREKIRSSKEDDQKGAYEIPQWLKDREDEKLIFDTIKEVRTKAHPLDLTNCVNPDIYTETLYTDPNTRYSPSTGKKLLSKEERSLKSSQGAIKRWKREKDKKESHRELLTLQNERLNMMKIRGSKGGKKSWESLTLEQRKLRAQKAVKARWKNHKKGEKNGK